MSAQEVIEQIKALPPQERARVVDFMHRLEAVSEATDDTHHIDRTTLEVSAEQIFDRYDGLFQKLAK